MTFAYRSTPGSDDAFLVLDRNGNGAVDNGSKLLMNLNSRSDNSFGYLVIVNHKLPLPSSLRLSLRSRR